MTNEYWVVPIDGSWVVRFDGQEVERFDEKMRAVVRAAALAKANPPGDVVVLDGAGGVEDRRSFQGP